MDELIAYLLENEIFLSLNGDTLKLKYNGETISDDLLTKIRANKAELIEYLRRQQQTSNYQDILPVNSAGPFELSSAQRKLWVLSQFEEGIDAYIIHGQKVLHENIQFEAFKKAIDATIDRHEILRTVFNENEDGTVKQWIKNRSDLNFELNWKDFRTNSAKEKSVQTYITEDLKQPFDLENGPLLRATMLRLEDDKYLLFFAMHHIISDGWSLDILSKNVFAYYTAFSQNEEPNLKPLQIQYKDYAAWQLAQLDEAPYKEHRNYWLQSLGGELPLLDLPSTKKRPLLKTSNGHALSMSIDSKITHLLKTYTQENGGSLFMTLLAGWNVLMYKYTAQQDFIIGTPLAGRDHANLQDQIGFYIKTLALRNNINPTESFNTFYKRLKQNTLHSFSHQSYPFDELVEDLNLQRDMSRSAVFDVMLTLQSASEKGEKLDLNRTEENQVIDRGPCTSKFDIEIEAQEIGNSVSLDIFYNTDVYDKETIIGLSYHYRQVLKALFESPEKNIGQIDCLSDTEKENLLFKFNDTEVDYPAGQTVLDLFQAQVSKTPNQTAVISGEECLTYLELDEKSNQLADYLLKNYAINSDDLIGIKLTRNHWMLVVILGVIKSGGAYVPIDPNYPQDRIDFIEKDTNCKVCIDEIELNQFKENQVHYSSGQHTAKITENQLAYVIYTSGSTGNPKGVMIEHKNVFSFIKWSHDEFKTSAYDAVLFTTSLNFDLSIFEIFHPLTIGKELIVLENGLSTPEYSKSSKKLMLNTVPSVVGELLQQGMSFESISTLNMAGEPIPLAYKLALQNQVKEIRNLYGPSEDTTYSTFFRVDGDDRDLIGKPISNTRIYILNESDQLQLSGAIGEIAISGNGVTRGYLNRPELTKEKFVDNPFIANERLYKTGDLGRWLTDGNIALIGRKDDQVKIRGFRIELGEIEHALAQHKEIDRAVAMVTVNEKTTEKDLTIYFTLKNAQTETSETAIDATEVGRSEDLRNHLKELLPQYMLPSYYMELEELPLTTNGKIDKKALPNPQGAGLNNATVYVAPRNQLEEKLAEIWADILQQDQVGIKDDFLTLGGQSLKAVRLRNEYRRAFDVKLALKDLFTHTTIEAHAGLIESSNKTRFLKINSVNTAENYPISDAQRRIWVLSQFESESMAYNIPVSIQLSQDIEIESFKKAIAATIERHEILRTIFKTNIKSEIRQWVLNSNDLAFEIDYCDLRKEADPQNVAEQYIEKDGKLPFDLEKGPLLRASLLQLEEQAYVFYFNMHHIISDGWSMDVLAKDVLKFYQAYQNDLTPELKELVIQYKDYSAWQLEQLADESLESHRAFWLSNLSGELSLLDLPSAKQRPRIKTHNGRTLLSYLDKLSTTKINAFSEKQGGSLFMTLLASWNVMFHHYTGQSDVIIGTPVAGREHADLEDQIGLYINTLALRNKINPKESFSNFHKTLRENTLKSYDHQIYPYDRLIEELNLERDTSRNPVFDVMLMLQNNGEQQQEYALTNNTKDNGVFEEDLNQVLDLGPVLSKFDIAITFEEVKGHLALRFEYNEDVYEKEMVERLIGHYKQLVNTLLDDPTQEIGQVNYLAASEKHELLHEFNSGEITYPKNRTVIDLFEGRAAENPTKLALVFEGVGLNYQELNERANQLAHYLKATYKVAPSDIIAIQLPRNENLIITILAILKAGAAYLPIDIDAPEEKIAYVAQDSKCLLIIDADKLALFNTECKTYPTTNLEKDFGPNDLIYVIYTSGSTGLPKGVLIEHNHLVAHIHNVKELYGVSSESRFLQFFNVAFDAAAQEFFTTLSFGATLYLKTTEVDPAYIFDLLSTNKITHADFSTAFFNSLIAAFNPETFAHQLQFCAIGGEKLEKGILEKQWQQISKFTRAFYNVYGPTETTLIATYFPIIENGELANFGDTIPIGQPYPGRQVLILDENQQLQPIGVTGEICVGGISIARGYLNRKDLTAEKFLPNPYKSGERLYRTGDLGKYLANGNIEFSGRKDDQVKIRGYRIELGEVEHALSKHEEIQEVVVITIENEAKIKELVAYFSSSVQQNSNDIRTFLKETLAAYMVPAYFVQLDELPLTPNGKVDKKALPNPEDLGLTSGVEFVASTTAQEELLISVWSTVLKRKGIGIKDSFYNLGGDSIKSIQVVARLKEHGYVLKVENLLRTPVLDELAQLMTRTEREIDQSEVIGEVELTPIQQWFFETDEVKNFNHFNQSILLKTNEAIDSDALDKSIEMLTEHHDALRMVFKNTDEGWQQTNRNLEEKAYAIDFYDLHNSANALEEMAALGNKIQASISITDGPLLKVVHFKLKTGERLGLILHHLVVDGVSWRIILEDLSTLYSQFKTNQSIKLPQKSDAFKTWSTALNKYATSPQIQYEKAYWETISKQDFSSLSGTENNVENVIDAVESFQLDKATTELLQTQVHAIYKTEINDILLTCLGRAIDEVFEVDKVLLQLEGHGREDLFNDIDISRTVGWFTAAFPFVLDVSTSSKTETNLINVKEALRTIPTKGIGYGVLKYLTENSLPQIDAPVVSFNYLGDFGSQAGNQENSLFEYSDEAIGANIAKENENRSILDLAGVLVIGELNLSIRYSSKRFEQAIIQELALAYKNNLQDLIETLARRTDSILTPSDLSFKGLTIAELSTVNAANKLEDVYELSPLQEGIYYHWLSDEESEQYLEQATYTVRIADLSKAHLERAYSKLIERHSVLRTHFSHDYANNTLQFVNKEVVNEFLFEKIADTENVTNYIKESIQKDRATPFDLSKGSQMRLKVVDLSGGEYVFIWTYHHILMDGWCTSVLVNDFNEFLSAEKAETQVSLAPVKPYANYINWLKTVDEDISLKYWSDYLNDYSQVAEIPFQLNKQEASFSEGREELNIEGQLLNDIGALCQEIGITQNTFIQGVWGYLLAQYNNTNDVVFGAVVSGRPAELNGVEEMIGLFINSIPVRIKYETSSSVVDFLKTIQEQSIETTAHHYLNLSKVQSQSELGIGLINHIMIFENYAVKELEHDAELTVDAMEVFERTNYDFNITVVPSANNLTIRFDFNENSFDGNLMKQLVDHFNNLTAAFVNSANEPMHQLDYLSANEKQELLRDFNNTTETYPIEKTIQTIFEEIVNENPANTAICFEDRQLSYQELNEQSNQLAHYLQTTYKIQPDDLIGIKQDRSEWMIISILAILKSGGAYVPIDPAYPADRIRYIEEDINCKVTLDSAELEKFKSVQYNSPRTNVKSITETNHLAYVTYTSGSTGKPKGVMITHTDLVSFIAGFDTGKGKRIAGSTNLTFDISGLEIWGALCTGKELVLLSNDQLNDPFQFIEKIEQANVNVLQLTPSRLAQIYLIKDAFPSSLDLVLVGGEMLNEVLYNWLKEQPFKSINVYGPTETTIWSTALIINDSKELSIGKPLTNEQVYILSNENNLQAKGVIGEICIGGDGVARGYLNRKELTEEKFIETPFNGNARIYKTGDLGMWLPNGNLACLGRKDDQIKIRGHRIELGEIEHALQGHKTINEVIVLAKENELVAYLTINADKQELSTSDLRAFLKELIPLYMLPAHFVQLEQFPLNTNGKIDKKALPKPDGLGLDSGMEYVAPRTEIERKLVEIWEALLTAENIGIKADFFALGGHSLMAIRLTNAYQKELNVKVAFKNLLADTVLESHARLIEQSEKIDFTPIPVVNVEEGAAHGYQISDAQQRLWILSQMEKGSTAYSITGQVPLAGEYEIAHFKRAVEATVERHEILRTNFRKNEQGEIRQWVLSNTELSFEVKYIDFRGEKDAEAAAQAYINEDSLVPFDLANDPLLRASLLQLTDGAYVFYYNMHHITSDAWSLDVLTNDVLSYYEAFSTNSKPKLSPLTIQYKDYAAWQAAELREEKASSHKNFWNENLTGPLPVLEFPFINKRPAVKAYNGKVCATFIDADITEQMRTISRSNGGTLFHGMLASWLVLVHKYSGAEDLIMGTSVAGRNHPDLHNQIGFYSNSVALRNEINPAHDFNETLKKVIENTHQAMDHQSYPFNQLVSDLKLERDLSKHPVFDNMIVFQSDRNTADLIDIEGIDFDEITNSELNAKFDMEISIMDLKDIISFRIIYDAALFSQSKVKNILLDYKLLLTELLSDPTENIEYVQFKNLVQKELRTANLSKLMSK